MKSQKKVPQPTGELIITHGCASTTASLSASAGAGGAGGLAARTWGCGMLGECNLLSKWEQLWKSYGTVVEHRKKILGTVVECTAM